jgi:hypothetical protein
VANSVLRKIAGEALPMGQDSSMDSPLYKILQRVDDIREAFRLEEGAIDKGEYVDFDHLNERFPWISFLGSIVRWSQLRMEEVNGSIAKQGGVENITTLLAQKMKSLDSQIELFYEPPKAKQGAPEIAKSKSGLLPAATIIPASAGKR